MFFKTKKMPRHTPEETLATLLRYPVVPVFYHADVAYAQRIVRACYAGGIRVVEFVNRGAQALAVFTELQAFVRAECADMLLGIGTIYTAAEAAQFIGAGAGFVVQPVAVAEVADVCRARNIAWLPGALTPTEIYHASQFGAAVVKIFPGNVVGPDYVKALRGPMPHIKLMVTGGVEPTRESLAAWFGAGVDAVGMGSQLFTDADDTDALAARIGELMAFVHELKK